MLTKKIRTSWVELGFFGGVCTHETTCPSIPRSSLAKASSPIKSIYLVNASRILPNICRSSKDRLQVTSELPSTACFAPKPVRPSPATSCSTRQRIRRPLLNKETPHGAVFALFYGRIPPPQSTTALTPIAIAGA
jgi:hypothetical protein